MDSTTSRHQQDQLLHEVEKRSKEIHTDAYPMSIGELMSVYKDGELDIHPEFQRFFRWSVVQKSKLIESILLGIPIPSIFVSQRDDGVWDVVDGVQRLSTIFEFTGILRDENSRLVPKSTLVGTDYLPSLEGKQWDNEDEPQSGFPTSLRLDFKRQKLDLKIIKKESDENTKYDLFERLNTLGSHLSDQEVRNCILVMINRNFYAWLSEIGAYPAFEKAISLTDTSMDERYNLELALRFVIFSVLPEQELKDIRDVGEYVTKRMRLLATQKDFDTPRMDRVFKKTFDVLFKTFGSECFRRTDGTLGRGGFLISVFEVLAFGLGWRIWSNPDADIDRAKLRQQVAKLWKNSDFKKYSGSGKRASTRLPKLVPLGRELFGR